MDQPAQALRLTVTLGALAPRAAGLGVDPGAAQTGAGAQAAGAAQFAGAGAHLGAQLGAALQHWGLAHDLW